MTSEPFDEWNEFEIAVIEFVKANPVIYDARLMEKQLEIIEITRELWEGFSQKWPNSEVKCSTRWSNIKKMYLQIKATPDKYTKEIKKKYLDGRLSFLDPIIQQRMQENAEMINEIGTKKIKEQLPKTPEPVFEEMVLNYIKSQPFTYDQKVDFKTQSSLRMYENMFLKGLSARTGVSQINCEEHWLNIKSKYFKMKAEPNIFPEIIKNKYLDGRLSFLDVMANDQQRVNEYAEENTPIGNTFEEGGTNCFTKENIQTRIKLLPHKPNDPITEKLIINYIKKKPFLYDLRVNLDEQAILREKYENKLLEGLSAETGISVIKCKEHWLNLKNNYLKIKAEPDAFPKNIQYLYLGGHLSFIDPITQQKMQENAKTKCAKKPNNKIKPCLGLISISENTDTDYCNEWLSNIVDTDTFNGFERILIDYIKDYPILYDERVSLNIQSTPRQKLKLKLWEGLSIAIGASVSDCQENWKRIRIDYFCVRKAQDYNIVIEKPSLLKYLDKRLNFLESLYSVIKGFYFNVITDVPLEGIINYHNYNWDDFELKIIEFVKGNPINYKELWKNFSKNLNLSANYCSKRWNSIRNKHSLFLKELRGNELDYNSLHCFRYKALSFLNDTNLRKTNESNRLSHSTIDENIDNLSDLNKPNDILCLQETPKRLELTEDNYIYDSKLHDDSTMECEQASYLTVDRNINNLSDMAELDDVTQQQVKLETEEVSNFYDTKIEIEDTSFISFETYKNFDCVEHEDDPQPSTSAKSSNSGNEDNIILTKRKYCSNIEDSDPKERQRRTSQRCKMSEPSDEWNEFDEAVIEFVLANPIIYDVRLMETELKTYEITRKLWEEFSKKWPVSGMKCSTHWANIKKIYFNIKIEPHKYTEIRKKKYLDGRLSFLDPIIQQRMQENAEMINEISDTIIPTYYVRRQRIRTNKVPPIVTAETLFKKLPRITSADTLFNKFELMLINYMQERPFLYDTRVNLDTHSTLRKMYGNTLLKGLSARTGVSEEKFKEQWLNIQRKYFKIKAEPDIFSKEMKSKYLDGRLSFLDPIIKQSTLKKKRKEKHAEMNNAIGNTFKENDTEYCNVYLKNIADTDTFNDFEIKLIDYVKDYPFLYDERVSLNTHSTLRQIHENELWKDLSTTTGASVSDCQENWSRIRIEYFCVRKAQDYNVVIEKPKLLKYLDYRLNFLEPFYSVIKVFSVETITFISLKDIIEHHDYTWDDLDLKVIEFIKENPRAQQTINSRIIWDRFAESVHLPGAAYFCIRRWNVIKRSYETFLRQLRGNEPDYTLLESFRYKALSFLNQTNLGKTIKSKRDSHSKIDENIDNLSDLDKLETIPCLQEKPKTLQLNKDNIYDTKLPDNTTMNCGQASCITVDKSITDRRIEEFDDVKQEVLIKLEPKEERNFYDTKIEIEDTSFVRDVNFETYKNPSIMAYDDDPQPSTSAKFVSPLFEDSESVDSGNEDSIQKITKRKYKLEIEDLEEMNTLNLHKLSTSDFFERIGRFVSERFPEEIQQGIRSKSWALVNKLGSDIQN